MMKTIEVDNKVWKGDKQIVQTQKKRVFVLREDEKSIVYIPVKALMRVDYERIVDIAKKADGDLLTALRDTRLENGMNALVLYENSISVKTKETKPVPELQQTQETQSTEAQAETEPQPKRRGRKPGPKPKNQQQG